MQNNASLSVVKIGGNIIDDPPMLESFLYSFSKMKSLKVLVHGGGKIATTLCKKLGIETVLKLGRRVTDRESLDVTTMVYAGLINKKIVAQLQKNNCNAMGVSGADANIIEAKKRSSIPFDYGFVGDIVNIRAEMIQAFLEQGIIPVFCAISHDKSGQLLNINADTIAAEVSVALSVYHPTILYYCFDKKGVLEDINHQESVIKWIDRRKYKYLKEKKIIAEGMIPKLENSFNAIKKGVSRVIIGSPHAIKDQEPLCTTILP